MLTCLLAWSLVWGQDAPPPAGVSTPRPAGDSAAAAGTVAAAAVDVPAAREESVSPFRHAIVPFLAANCYVCHGQEKQWGDLDLSKFTTMDSLAKDRDVWRKVMGFVQTGEMPPTTMPTADIPPGGIPSPSTADRELLVKTIKTEFDRIDRLVTPTAGRVSARRLNRVEYNNTVQDLLGVKLWPASDFPQDDAAYGFDNVADALTISPALMERYMNAAEQVARAAVFGVDKAPTEVKKLEQLERSVTNITVVPKEYDESGLTTDRALHAIHHFPVDGVYVFRVTAQRVSAAGLGEPGAGILV